MSHAREPETPAASRPHPHPDPARPAADRPVAPEPGPAALLRLQNGAGNAAVAELVRHRQAVSPRAAPGKAAEPAHEANGQAGTARLARRPKPTPARQPRPRDAGSTLVAGAPPVPSAAPPQTVSPEPAVGPAPDPPALEGGAAGPAEAEAEAPAPGLGDDELATLDQGAVPAPVTEPAGPVVQTEPDDGPGAVPDLSAAQGEIAANAQAEVETIGADGGQEPESGGGDGGGGAPIEEPPTPVAPNVAGAQPEQAMAQLGALPAGQLAASLGGVQAATGVAVAREQGRLAAAPPQHTPLANTTTLAAPASSLVPAAGAAHQARVGRVRAGTPHLVPPPRPVPAPGPAATSHVPAPALPAAPQGGLSESAARDLSTSIGRLPAHDPGTQVAPGPAPHLALTGDADPGQVTAQQARLTEGTAQAQAEGARDATEPLGEDAVHPTTAVETMRAEVPAAPAGAGGAEAALAGPGAESAEAGDEAVSAVAEEQQGPQLRAAAASASAAMAGTRAAHAEQEQARRRQSAEQIGGLERAHAEAETTQRAGVRTEVAEQRTQWRTEQRTLVTSAHAEAHTAVGTAGQTVRDEQRQAETEAAQHHQQGAQEAAQARREGEQEAARHRAEAHQESGGGGFFGWIASRAQALFDRVKQGIAAAFEKARQAVRAAIEKAQQLATAVIEKARQVAVAAIRLAGTVLTAIGDRVLAGFPALRDRFRNAIQARVRQAEAAVNRLAEGLKSGVRAALGLLGRGLSALLSGLEAGLKAVVDGVAATVRGAINAAKAALQALGTFMAIAKDVASNPGAWLRNLGAAIMDGIRNHLWLALKNAIQQWFNDKVEQVLGLGRAVWNLLTRGGISLAKIGQLAWEGIKQAIPAALIAILIEKLASMIMPAAGAVLAIIQGLQAAWGAVSRILQAIDRFITFLKAVKSGNGGQAFAAAVAAAAVAVIDFVSNWLLTRLARGASRIGNKIRAIAQRIGAAIKRVAKRIGGALKRLGKRIGDRFRGVGDRFRAWRDRRRRESPADREKRLKERLDRAVAAIKPQATRLLAKGTTPLLFRIRLAWWKVRHRLSGLTMDSGGKITARLNPTVELDEPQGRKVTEAELGALLTPVFRAAELKYQVHGSVQTRERAAAAAAWQAGNANALGGLSRAEQQTILRNSRPGARDMWATEDTSVRLPRNSYQSWQAGRVGKVEGLGRYEGMTTALLARGRQFGLTAADFAAVLSSGRVNQGDLLQRMRRGQSASRLARPVTQREQAYMNSVHRLSFLAHSVEPARRVGHSVSSATAFSMLGERPELLKNVLEGNMAPMAPVGAASQRDTPKTREAAALGQRRVGAIFSTLLEITKSRQPLVAKSGADLGGLAEAIRVWLAQQLAAKPDPEALANARAELTAGIIRLLTTYYGRST